MNLRLLLFALACLGLASCNTIRGAGADIEHAGEEIQENTPM